MEYYNKKYKKRKRRKAKVLLLIFFFIFVFAFVYNYCIINPVVIEASRHSVYSLSTSAVSDAIYDVIQEENISYEDLIKVQYDDAGNVAMIALQTVTLNLMARRFYQVAQVYLDNMGKKGIDIAIGAFTGIPALIGYGPSVNIKLVPIGAMTSTFESKFTHAGINQTNHSVFIRLYASVSMILPTYTATIDSVTEMLVAESVIVGEVPSVYLGANSPLNFSPN